MRRTKTGQYGVMIGLIGSMLVSRTLRRIAVPMAAVHNNDTTLVCARCYSNAPSCMPARYTWISGRYPHYHGAWDNVGRWLSDGTPILCQSEGFLEISENQGPTG